MVVARTPAASGKLQPNTVAAEPQDISLDPARAARVIVDMQRDFLEPGGFGAALGNDVSRLAAAVAPCRAVLEAARRAGLLVVHTREGHRPDLSDAPRNKVERGDPATRIGAPEPMGRILVRGEPGHDIVPALAPIPGEPVIDKPGKGAFYQTDLDLVLKNRRVDTLVVCGVTTEVARETGRDDVCALPSGISVAHMFIVVFVIMLPITLRTNDPVKGWEAGLGPVVT